MSELKISITDQVRQYDALRAQSKKISAEMTRLADIIKKYAEAEGVKDDKGSYYCEDDHFIFGNQAKKSVKFKDEIAIPFLKDKGLDEAVKTIEVIDDSAVEKYVKKGSITFEEFESMTETKTVYAVIVKPKEEITEEVYQSEISLPKTDGIKNLKAPALKIGKKHG